MVQLIVGKKGKGKTKQLLDKVNGIFSNVCTTKEEKMSCDRRR